MELPDYIREIGDQEAAARFGVTVRAVQAWRRRERFPRREQAERIVSSSPVTYEGIYGRTPKEGAAA